MHTNLLNILKNLVNLFKSIEMKEKVKQLKIQNNERKTFHKNRITKYNRYLYIM